MTDSIKSLLSLSKLPPMVRMNVPANICSVSTAWGEHKDRYTKPSKQPSALADTETKWVVRCESGVGELEGYRVPARIDAMLNIPNALTGQNLVHGTSVYAAGVAALYLQKIWLAHAGIPREHLEQLTTSEMSLSGVTITYTVPFEDHANADNLVDNIKATGKVLYGDRCVSWHSGNETVRIPGRNFTVTVYIKSDFRHCAWADGAPVDSIKGAARYLVRIEAKLGLPFLQARGLTTLESWRDAYKRGIYEQIFNETVRKSLRLTGERLRHKAPREEVFVPLTPTVAEVLRGYLAEPPIDPRRSKTVVGSVNPAQRFYEVRKLILKHTRIDVDIPWVEHVKLRCFELKNTLTYPGDYHPNADHVAWSFCQSNWNALLNRLDEAYKDAKAPTGN